MMRPSTHQPHHLDIRSFAFATILSFSAILIEIPDVHQKCYQIAISRYNLVQIGSGLFGNVFTTFVLLWNHPAGAFFSPKSQFSEILDMVIFQKVSFRQKLDFWVTYLERCLIKVVHMDRTDHLGFR